MNPLQPLLAATLATLFAVSAAAAAPAQTVGGIWNNKINIFSDRGFSEYGFSMDDLGDVDGDGVRDLVSGAYAFQNKTGSVYVHSGADGHRIHFLRNTVPGDRYGWDVARLDDYDGDGVFEFAATAPLADPNGLSNAGKIIIHDGAVAGNNFREIVGDQAHGHFGSAVCLIHDIDNDGFQDIAVGADEYDNGADLNVGAVIILSGKNGQEITRVLGLNPETRLGGAIAVIGDIDGDLIPDLVAGGRNTEVAGNPFTGAASVFSGADLSVIHVVTGEGPDNKFGQAVGAAGDVDNDGIPDFVVGAPFYDDAIIGQDVGAAYLYSGATGNLMRKYVGEAEFDQFGIAVAGNIDMDGDQRPDLIIGAPKFDNQGTPETRHPGKFYVYSADGSILFTREGDNGRVDLGRDIVTIGDMDNDGLGEIYVSGPWYRSGGIGTDRTGINMHWEYDPFLYLDNQVLSSATGGQINLSFEFQDALAGSNYQLLMSQGTGPQWDPVTGQVIPMSPGNIFNLTVARNYSMFTNHSGLSGVLDANGNATGLIDQGPINPAAIGRVYYLCGITTNANGNATESSAAMGVLIDP